MGRKTKVSTLGYRGNTLATTIADNIKYYREKSPFSQSSLARHIGLTPATISAIEAGKRVPSLETLDKIAKALGLPAHLFLTPRN